MPTKDQLDIFVSSALKMGQSPGDVMSYMESQGWIATQPIAPVFQARQELEASGALVKFTNPVGPGGDVAGQIGPAYSLMEATALNVPEDFLGLAEGSTKASSEMSPLITGVPFVGQAASLFKGAFEASKREVPEGAPEWRRELNRLAQESEEDYLRFGEGDHRQAKLFGTRAAFDILNAAPGIGFSDDLMRIGRSLGNVAAKSMAKGILTDDQWARALASGLSEEAVETTSTMGRQLSVAASKARKIEELKKVRMGRLAGVAEDELLDLGASPVDAARVAHDQYAGKVARLTAEYNDNLARLHEMFPAPREAPTVRVRPENEASFLELGPLRGDYPPGQSRFPSGDVAVSGEGEGIVRSGMGEAESMFSSMREGTPPGIETTMGFKRLAPLDQALVTSRTPDALPEYYKARRRQLLESLAPDLPVQSDDMRPAMSRNRRLAEEALTKAYHRDLAETHMEYKAFDELVNSKYAERLNEVGGLEEFNRHAAKLVEREHAKFLLEYGRAGDDATRAYAKESIGRVSREAAESATLPADEIVEAVGRMGNEQSKAYLMTDAGVPQAEVYGKKGLLYRVAERAIGTFLGGEEGAMGEGLLRIAASRYKDPAVRRSVLDFAKFMEKSEGDKAATIFQLQEFRRQVSREVKRFAKDNRMTVKEAGEHLKLNEARRGKDLSLITDDGVRGAVGEAGAFIDELSKRFVKEGLIEGNLIETFRQNLGGYMHTSYAFTHAKNWADQVAATTVWDDAFDWFRKNYPDMTEEQIQGTMLWMVDRQQATTFGKGAKAFRDFLPDNIPNQQLDELLKKKDIPPELQELFGINKDFLVDFDITGAKMVHDLEATALQRKILAEGLRSGAIRTTKEATPGATTGHVAPVVLDRISKERQFWVTPELAKALGVFNEKLNQHTSVEMLMAFNGMTKFGKIVPSPSTQARNAWSLVPMLIQNGTLASSLKPGSEAWEAARLASKVWKIKVVRGKTAAKLTKAEEELVLQGHKYNLFNTGVFSGEQEIWAKQMGDAVRGTGRKIRDTTPVKAGEAAFDAMRRNYQSVDDFGKFFTWQVTRKKFAKMYDPNNVNDMKFLQEVYGTTNIDEAAAEFAKQTFQHFPRTAPIGKKLARFPIAGTFVSFPLEMARNLKNTLKISAQEMKWFAQTQDPKHLISAMNKVSGVVAAGSIFAGITKHTSAKFGVDEVAFEDLVQAPWAKGNDYAITNVDGSKITFADAGFINPYKDTSNVITSALMSGKPIHEGLMDAAKEIEEILLGREIAVNAITTLISGREPRGGLVSGIFNPKEGRRIANPQDDDQWDKRMYHFLKTIAPGGLVSAERIARAAGAGPGFGWAPKSATEHKQSVASEVFGLMGFPRTTTIDAADSFSYRVWDLGDEFRDLRSARNSDSRMESTPEGWEMVDEVYGEKWSDLEDQLISSIESAKKLNVSRRDILKHLESLHVKEAVRMRLVNGVKSNPRMVFGPPKRGQR